MRPELRFEKQNVRAAELGEEAGVPDLLGESILQNRLEFQLGEQEEIYEGFGRRENAWPYRQRNGYTRELKMHEVQTAVLENDYLKAVFLPEFGGRLWNLTDKTTGRNLLYTNDVLRFSNLAVRNAWFSGGVEWNIGMIGHTPFTAEKLYTACLRNASGNPVLRMYEYERVRKVTWQMDFWLDEESRFLNCRMRIANENAEVVPMYWWSNIAVPEYPEGRIVVPADQAYTSKCNMVYKTDIPVVDGTDITDYGSIPDAVDYFFDIPKKEPKYIANLDKTGWGLLQVSTERLKSRKLFSWGHQKGSAHWQEFLTEKGGKYIEIQAGLGKTQYGCIPMAPHTVWEWMEQYGAVKIDSTLMGMEHKKRREEVTALLNREEQPKKMEALLEESREQALARAEVLFYGSGCGVLAERGNSTRHLQFQASEKGILSWKAFLETGKLHEPDVTEKPDFFPDDERSFEILKQTIRKQNKKNWYAHYQLGVRWFMEKRYKKAGKAFTHSVKERENAWGYHGLACVKLKKGKKQDAADVMMKGIKLRRRDHSYLKEGFRILFFAEAYKELKNCYEKLGTEEKAESRLKFYYIYALCRLGRYKKAYRLLEENGGLVLDDIREGENSAAELWQELYTALHKKKGKIPYKYDFRPYS